MKARHGLVIGKFYPPHAGHHLLIRTAAALSERLTVVVAGSHVESLPPSLRASWVREVHPEPHVDVVPTWDDHPIDLSDDAVWEAHVAVFRDAARSVNPAPVDVVFTSETYGDELARRLGARHATVDPARGLAPVSGTAVRADPAAYWELLEAPVRAHLALRVAIVGAESTGKTTLADELATRLRARGGAFGLVRWVPEYGRQRTIDKLAEARARARLAGAEVPEVADLVWDEEDFVRIAATQNRWEDAAARVGGPVLICDTDAFATGLWHERYRGTRSAAVEALAKTAHVTLLTHPDDVPFVQDGLRDGERVRHAMTERFAAQLAASGRPWCLLRGDREGRVRAALAEVGRALAAGSGLAAPLVEARTS